MDNGGQKRAAIYCRVSTPGQEQEGTSLQTQDEACRKYAAEHGYRLSAVFKEAHTGSELHTRRELSKLRDTITSRQVDVVIAYAVDRLSRNQAHVYIIADECERAGVSLEFVTESFEDSAVGKFIRSAKAFAGELEHEKIVERTMRGKLAKVRSGKPLGAGSATYGYVWRDDAKTGYALDPYQAEVVARVFREMIEGKSLRQIAAGLTRDAIPPSRGGPSWCPSSVRDMLRRPHYVGEAYAWRFRNKPEPGSHGKLRPPDEWIRLPAGTMPAIVDQETWDEAQRVLDHNREHRGRQSRRPEAFLLAGGFAVCGYCGWPMHSATARGRIPMYQCGRICHRNNPCADGAYIIASKLDATVWARIETILTNPDIIAAEVEKLRTTDPTEHDLGAVERGLAGVSRKQTNLVRRLGDLDDEGLAEAVKLELLGLSEQRQKLQVEREALLRRQASWHDAHGRLGALQAWCGRVAGRVGKLDYEGKRLALRALGVQVKLYRHDHTPRYEITANIPLGGDGPKVCEPSRRTVWRKRTQSRWRGSEPCCPRSAEISDLARERNGCSPTNTRPTLLVWFSTRGPG